MNPFIERRRITDPHHFIGRWRELSVIFDQLVAGRPVLVGGISGIGRSSLLTHVAQSAAVNLERPGLQAFYIDLAVLPDAAACYELILKALSSRGDSAAALEVALLDSRHPVLICLDNAQAALAAGWGEGLLEQLARIARRSLITRATSRTLPGTAAHAAAMQAPVTQADGMNKEPALLIVAAATGTPPTLSEPFARVGLGAFAAAEIRLFSDAYLEGSGVQFSPGDIRDLSTLSLGHPAYLQRAAFHLFISHTQPGYDWRSAYQEEVQDRPVPGAPLPPGVFEGDEPGSIMAFYGDPTAFEGRRELQKPELTGIGDLLVVPIPFIAALLAWQISANWLITSGVLLVCIGGVVLLGRQKGNEEGET